jgi:hypothetical protein
MAPIPFATVPATAKQQPAPFEFHVDEQKLQDLKTLLRLSPVAKETYESLQDDGGFGRFGVGRKWIVDAKKYWEEEYDWYDTATAQYVSCSDTLQASRGRPHQLHSGFQAEDYR